MIFSPCLRSSARALAASSPRAAFLEALQCELSWPSLCSSQLPETPILNPSVVCFWLDKGAAGLQWQDLDSLFAGWIFWVPAISHIKSAFPKVPGRLSSSASEELEQTEAPFFSLGFLAIPAAIAAVCDLLKDTPHPRPLLPVCLCGSCVTEGPWPSPGMMLQVTELETEKAQARGEQRNWC